MLRHADGGALGARASGRLRLSRGHHFAKALLRLRAYKTLSAQPRGLPFANIFPTSD